MLQDKPPLAMTMGDPAGIGPELALYDSANKEIILMTADEGTTFVVTMRRLQQLTDTPPGAPACS